jgi:hypothetical protein
MADSKNFRDEAARLRQEAAATHDPELQRTMLDIAGLFERMADELAKWSRLEKR